MKAANKTKKELVVEVEALRTRVSELERYERDSRHALRDFGEKMGRYFLQADHMNEAIFVVFDRKLEFINDKFAEMFSISSEEACGDDFNPMSLVAPESRSYMMEQYREGGHGTFATKQFDFTGLTKDGLKIECETSLLFIPYKWGVAVHGLLRNISMRKRIDEELQRHRNDLQIVLNSIPTSVFYTDRDHRFIQANQAFCKSLGLPMEQIIGKTLTDLFPNLPPEQLDQFYAVSDQVMMTGRSKRGITEIFPSLRGRRWIQNDRVPYCDEKGNIIGVICLAIDISDFRETEEKLVYLSFHDVLTGLYNRAYFDEEMVRLENSRKYPISIVAMSMDGLQSINDTNGIAAGNEYLRRTAAVTKTFRTEDVVARISGHRFAALLPTADKSTGEEIVRRLRSSLEAHNSEYLGSPMDLSFGVATGEKGCSLVDIMKQAEASVC